MKKTDLFSRQAFTIAEGFIAMGLAVVLALFMASFLRGGTILFAKNLSTNLTQNAMRTSLDKLTQAVSAGCSSVTLVTTTGSTVTSGSAAGVVFDRYIAGPYVMANSGTTTSIAASATSVSVKRSTASGNTTPIIPQNAGIVGQTDTGLVLLIDGYTTRLKVKTTPTIDSGSGISGSVQTMSVPLNASVGTAMSWDSSRVKRARLIRREAYVVIPIGDRNELRYFPAAESITNFSTASANAYTLVIKNVGIDAGDSTPFSKSTLDGIDYLKVTMRVRSDQYGRRLSDLERNKFTSIQRIEFLMEPRAN